MQAVITIILLTICATFLGTITWALILVGRSIKELNRPLDDKRGER